MTEDGPANDLTEHEEESVPFDEVMRKLPKAKPTFKEARPPPPKPSGAPESDL